MHSNGSVFLQLGPDKKPVQTVTRAINECVLGDMCACTEHSRINTWVVVLCEGLTLIIQQSYMTYGLNSIHTLTCWQGWGAWPPKFICTVNSGQTQAHCYCQRPKAACLNVEHTGMNQETVYQNINVLMFYKTIFSPAPDLRNRECILRVLVSPSVWPQCWAARPASYCPLFPRLFLG